jgi:hypothetical protein
MADGIFDDGENIQIISWDQITNITMNKHFTRSTNGKNERKREKKEKN